MPTEVSVRNLRKNYGSLEAVRGIDLDISSGEIFGLLGPNGAGKTTTLECLLGLRAPEAGSISIGGFDGLKQAKQVKQIVGAQLQSTALQDRITAREALKFFGSFYRNAISADRLIERFSLGEKADKPFDSLSDGQKQRLGLALAFVNDPRVIFLDEPTAGLDPQSRRELHGEILKLKSEGRTILLSTHYMEEAARLCDRVAIINAGEIVAMGRPGELVDRAKVLDRVVVKTDPVLGEGSVFETEDVGRTVIELVKKIESEGVKLVDIQIERGSLEESYLKLIGGKTGSRGAG